MAGEHSVSSGFMRVFYVDGSWATIPARETTSTTSIVELLCKKRNIPAREAEEYHLFVVDSTPEQSFERRLDPSEFPLEIQEVVRKHGQLDHFKFVFKSVPKSTASSASAAAAAAANSNSSAVPPPPPGPPPSSPPPPPPPPIPAAAAGSASAAYSLAALGGPPAKPTTNSVASPAAHQRTATISGISGSGASTSSSGANAFESVDVDDDPDDGSGSDEDSSANMFGSGKSATKAPKVAQATDCVRSGYLDKKGKLNTTYRSRWFVLKDDKLFYFKTHTAASAISYIPVTDAIIREVGGGPGSSIGGGISANGTRSGRSSSNADDGNNGFCFEVGTKDRVFFLRARTAADMALWVRELKKRTALEAENDIIDDIQSELEAAELAKADADEREADRLSRLVGLLRSGPGLDYFYQFLSVNHLEENLLFWVDAEDYRSTKRTPADARKRGDEILSKFINSGAPFEIAVTGTARENCKKGVAAGDVNAFVPLQGKTYSLLEVGSFPQFLSSIQFQRTLLHIPIVVPTVTVGMSPAAQAGAQAFLAYRSNAYRKSLDNPTVAAFYANEKPIDFLTSTAGPELAAALTKQAEDEAAALAAASASATDLKSPARGVTSGTSGSRPISGGGSGGKPSPPGDTSSELYGSTPPMASSSLHTSAMTFQQPSALSMAVGNNPGGSGGTVHLYPSSAATPRGNTTTAATATTTPQSKKPVDAKPRSDSANPMNTAFFNSPTPSANGNGSGARPDDPASAGLSSPPGPSSAISPFSSPAGVGSATAAFSPNAPLNSASVLLSGGRHPNQPSNSALPTAEQLIPDFAKSSSLNSSNGGGGSLRDLRKAMAPSAPGAGAAGGAAAIKPTALLQPGSTAALAGLLGRAKLAAATAGGTTTPPPPGAGAATTATATNSAAASTTSASTAAATPAQGSAAAAEAHRKALADGDKKERSGRQRSITRTTGVPPAAVSALTGGGASTSAAAAGGGSNWRAGAAQKSIFSADDADDDGAEGMFGDNTPPNASNVPGGGGRGGGATTKTTAMKYLGMGTMDLGLSDARSPPAKR